MCTSFWFLQVWLNITHCPLFRFYRAPGSPGFSPLNKTGQPLPMTLSRLQQRAGGGDGLSTEGKSLLGKFSPKKQKYIIYIILLRAKIFPQPWWYKTNYFTLVSQSRYNKIQLRICDADMFDGMSMSTPAPSSKSSRGRRRDASAAEKSKPVAAVGMTIDELMNYDQTEPTN